MNSLIIDIYPFLSVKNPSASLSRVAVSLQWVPEKEKRRLTAYTVLAAYTANMANQVRSTVEDDLHEYGDANFVCTAMANAVIGDDVKIIAANAPDQEAYFTQWVEDELFFAKMVANEYKCSNLGDAVYRLNFSKSRDRVEITTFDPGFWFPFNIGRSDERHVLAWEEEDEDGDTVIYKEEYVRQDNASGRGQISVSGAYYKKGDGTLDDLARIRFATNSDGEELNNLALGIDFFPIVYIPNIYREGCDFGESDLTAVWRVLDQLANTYSDEAKNAYIMGLVQMWMERQTWDLIPVNESGQRVVQVGQGKIIPGRAGIVDNSTINKALIEYQHELEEKLRTNTFLGPVGAGTLKSGSADRTTGIVQVKGGPFERFVWAKRLIRQAKYNKLLKYVGLMNIAHGSSDVKKVFRLRGKEYVSQAKIQFGNILPIDQAAMITNIEKIKDNLSPRDLRDNLREAGLKLNDEAVASKSTTKKSGTTNVQA